LRYWAICCKFCRKLYPRRSLVNLGVRASCGITPGRRQYGSLPTVGHFKIVVNSLRVKAPWPREYRPRLGSHVAGACAGLVRKRMNPRIILTRAHRWTCAAAPRLPQFIGIYILGIADSWPMDHPPPMFGRHVAGLHRPYSNWYEADDLPIIFEGPSTAVITLKVARSAWLDDSGLLRFRRFRAASDRMRTARSSSRGLAGRCVAAVARRSSPAMPVVRVPQLRVTPSELGSRVVAFRDGLGRIRLRRRAKCL